MRAGTRVCFRLADPETGMSGARAAVIGKFLKGLFGAEQNVPMSVDPFGARKRQAAAAAMNRQPRWLPGEGPSSLRS